MDPTVGMALAGRGHFSRNSVTWRVKVRDAATGDPVDGVILTQVVAPDAQLRRDHALARSNAAGDLVWGNPLDGYGFLLADGYIPHPLMESDLLSGIVDLQAGAVVKVRVQSSLGRPMAGVKVLLRGASSASHEIPAVDSLIGNPCSADPEWVLLTDVMGEAEFSGLPNQKYSLRAWQDGCYPLTDRSALNEVDPPADVSLVMADVWGCVAEIPEGLQVATWRWSSNADLDDNINVILALPPNRSALDRRFPRCICVAAVPANEDVSVVMTCSAIMTNGTVWHVSWQLSRWKDITPVFLEQDLSTLAQEIRFKIHDPRGAELEVPIAIYDRARNMTIPVTGGSSWLVAGFYKAVPKIVSPWFKSKLSNPDFVIGQGIPSGGIVYLQLSETLHRLSVHLSADTGGSEALVLIRFLDENMTNATIVRSPSQSGPCVMYLPKGKYKVRAAGAHYAAEEQDIEVDADRDLTLKLVRIVR